MARKALKFFCCCCRCVCCCKPRESALHQSIKHSGSRSYKSYKYESLPLHSDCDSSEHEGVSLSGSWQDLTVDATQPSPPALECFIIPSFGEDPPGNVAVKLKMSDKMASKFLKGVGEDLDTIQQLIKEDDKKQLYEVRLMCHFAQKKVEEFKKAIGDAMKNIKLKRTPTQKGCKYNT